jgi:hypothetical protein
MWIKYWLLGLGWCCTLQAFAQGLLLDATSYQNVPDYFNPSGAKNAGLDNLERRHTVSLRRYCPRPRIQGEMASCSGWSAGYAALTIACAVRERWPDRGISPTDSAFSALFVYNQIKVGSCNGGSSLIDALSFLQKNGNVYFQDFDANVQECQVQPSFSLLLKAQSQRIQDYFKVFDKNDLPSAKIDKIRQCLRQQAPVIVAINLLENFKLLNRSNPVWYPTIGNTSPIGAHAMVIIGYDDTRKVFEVMNSWGEAWGEQGFGWIRYEDIPTFAPFGFTLRLPEPATQASEIGLFAGVLLRRLIGTRSNQLLFDTLRVQRQQGIYRVLSSLSLQDKIQIVIEQLKAGLEVHSFSLFEQAPGIRYSHVQGAGYLPLVVPQEYRALQFTRPGRQWLVLYLSTQPPPDPAWYQHFRCKDQWLTQLLNHWRSTPDQMYWLHNYAGGIDSSKQQTLVPIVFELNVE